MIHSATSQLIWRHRFPLLEYGFDFSSLQSSNRNNKIITKLIKRKTLITSFIISLGGCFEINPSDHLAGLFLTEPKPWPSPSNVIGGFSGVGVVPKEIDQSYKENIYAQMMRTKEWSVNHWRTERKR